MWYSNSMIVAALMILLPLAAVGWFIYSLITYFKTPKGYRRAQRSMLIVSAVTAVVLGAFLVYFRPSFDMAVGALIFLLPLLAFFWFVFNLVAFIKTPKVRRRPRQRNLLILSAVLAAALGALLYYVYRVCF